ncbi:LOW QUALITY PROTEIN: DNA repair protein RAD16-like [Salvia miltiorrhiza]|uniref:LOW QUALITY PROTEIN: DNA repair protein RAD16-like n=1 Tax=Salvia miltiorrhiza TaxID=226208 RepID=UPI0025ACF01A|nr:LOW QUALITY PROTEIN: DNA repair protein RAD16-like [Salvia miltiorrhiza]
MKLRSHGDGASSSKGKAKLKYGDSSDAEDYGAASSDSDFNVLSGDEGEDLLDVLAYSAEVFNLNYVSDEDGVPKRRKKNSYGKRGSQSSKKAEEEESERGTGAHIETVIGIDPGKIEFAGGIAEKSCRKKKGRKKKDRPILMWEVLEQENDRWIEENLQIDMDLINQNEIVMETVEPSDDLIIPLLRYQKEWLAWALKQEESTARGGILADEMGMGKTLQAIALVLFKRSFSSGIPDPALPSSSISSSRELPPIKGTLVICPLVAVMQWVREIDRFTSKGSTKVLVYHGANRAKYLYQLSDYDFVITTYAIVEAEFRKYVLPPKDKCQYCGKLFYEHKLKIHLKYMCGPGAVRTIKQAKQQRKELKCKKTPDLEVHTSEIKKGNKNGNGRKEMENDDSIESSDVTGLTSSKGKSILHCAAWERIVLDEAHCIKERRSNTTRAVLALQSKYKWALSGTPLQNRVGELYSLIRFLQIVPFSYYFCKDCDCRTLDYSSAECPGCEHKNVRHFCWWNRYVSTPIKILAGRGGGRGAMILLKHKILKSLVLRRTKKGRAADLALPPRIVTLRRDSLDIVEEDYYTALYNESQAQFNTYVDAGTLMNNYAHIFDLLTRLRQAVDHPYLVEYSLTAMERKGKTVDTRSDAKCGLCNDTEEDTVVTSCGHTFCKPCLIDFSASMGQNSCPTCSKPLTVDFTSNKDGKEQRSKTTIKGFRASSILNRIQLHDFQTSTKIDALREEIRFMVERDGSAKAIVFSQFSSFLDLIHYSLQKSGVHCVQLDGSMSMGARDAAIKKFTEDPSCRIFLMSLKAGGVALNLTAASHVFLMDPWWNPAVERQAQDRIHRIGQYKPIRIVRFIIENTVEERILKLQDKKELVFEGTVGGCSEALAKLTEADLRFLFVT